MRENTPPASPFRPVDDDDLVEFNEDEDELIYLGDADEVLARMGEGAEDDDDEDDEDAADDELGAIAEEDDDGEGSEPRRDDAVITFRKHLGPVFCGALHPSEDIAVTGGEDDKAYVWATDTGEVVFEVTGHKDSVISAVFSADGIYLATGDMAGEIQVFKVAQSYKKVWEFSMGDMSWMKWHTAANVLMAGCESGEVYVWRIPSGDCKVLQGNGEKSELGVLTADGKKLIVGYGDGAIKVWDIKTSTAVQHILAFSTLGHTAAVTSIAADPDNGMFLSGSEDGKILISSTTGPVSNLFPSAGTVEALAFCSEADFKLVACGTLEGKISLWDISKQTIRVECEHVDQSGVSRMLWAPGQNLLCSTLDGNVVGFDGRSGQMKFQLQGHYAEIYEMDYNKNKSLLLTTSEDRTAKLFTSFII